jgi:hypothetical protein
VQINEVFQCRSEEEGKLRYDLLQVYANNQWMAELFAIECEHAAIAASKVPIGDQMGYAYQRGVSDAFRRIVDAIQCASSQLQSIHQALDGE